MTFDITQLSESDKYRLGIYHTTNPVFDKQKLQMLYGRVAALQNRLIIDSIAGKKVLDVGAGYGLLARMLVDAGLDVVAIDPNEECCRLAREWYGVYVEQKEIYSTGFGDAEFDTVILREVVEHLDFTRAMQEINRIVRHELILFQTNLNLFVKLSRALTRHKEFNEQPLEYYERIIQQFGFRIEKVLFRDLVAFPLSGGFVTRQWFPNNRSLQNCLLMVDERLNRVFQWVQIQKFFCWRYMLYATREEKKGCWNGA